MEQRYKEGGEQRIRAVRLRCAQLTFEIEAALLLANAQYIVTRTPEPIERARRAISRRLELAAGAPRA